MLLWGSLLCSEAKHTAGAEYYDITQICCSQQNILWRNSLLFGVYVYVAYIGRRIWNYCMCGIFAYTVEKSTPFSGKLAKATG